MENKEPNRRKSDMRANETKKLFLQKSGSMNDLEKLTIDNNINIDFIEIVKTFPMYCQNLTEKQRAIFRLYYQKNYNIYDIVRLTGLRQTKDVESTLNSAKKKYIQYLLNDYGVKETEAS